MQWTITLEGRCLAGAFCLAEACAWARLLARRFPGAKVRLIPATTIISWN